MDVVVICREMNHLHDEDEMRGRIVCEEGWFCVDWGMYGVIYSMRMGLRLDQGKGMWFQ